MCKECRPNDAYGWGGAFDGDKIHCKIKITTYLADQSKRNWLDLNRKLSEY